MRPAGSRMARRRSGIYVKISKLAEIIGVSETAVVAAQKICGHVRIADRIWFTDGVRIDFVEEARLADAAERSAAQRTAQRTAKHETPPAALAHPAGR